MRAKSKSAFLGIVLIVVGALLLLRHLGVAWLHMDNLWPFAIIALGIYSLYSAVADEPRQPDGAWFGVVAILTGGLFSTITLGSGEWGDMRVLWPIFPGIAGLGWLVAYALNLRKLSNLVAGIIALVVCAVSYLFITERIGADTAQALSAYWPLILVILGIGLVAQFLIQRD